MAKKLERIFRDRHLTPEEVAADNDVRTKVQAEFPPLRSGDRPTSPLGDLLRQSIRQSGRSIESIADDAGVSPVLIQYFLAGERDIRLTIAEKLAHSLGLEVTID